MKWKVIRILSVNFSLKKAVHSRGWRRYKWNYFHYSIYSVLDSEFSRPDLQFQKCEIAQTFSLTKYDSLTVTWTYTQCMWNFALCHAIAASATFAQRNANKQTFISTTITMPWWKNWLLHTLSMFFNINFCRYWYRKWKTWSIFKKRNFFLEKLLLLAGVFCSCLFVFCAWFCHLHFSL